MDVEAVRRATVGYLLAVRAEYLAAGGSSLTHWEQIETRMLAAAKTTEDVGAWATQLQRRLRLTGSSKATSSALVELRERVGTDDAAFLDLVERQYALLIALARQQADTRRRARLEAEEYQAGLSEQEEIFDGNETL